MSERHLVPHALETLRAHLNAGTPAQLEELCRTLFSRLLDTLLNRARSGAQFGADGGTAGREDRSIRFECKRYSSEHAHLKDRELLGEIAEALIADSGLEAWLLVATIPVNETTRGLLKRMEEDNGLPIFVIDWTPAPSGLPDLAALCADAPDIVAQHYGAPVAAVAAQLTSHTGLARLRRELQPWQVGYEVLRSRSAAQIVSVWASPADSHAVLSQNVAGGSGTRTLTRKSILQQLSSWWAHASGQPLVVFGNEGVGKTWGVVQWLAQEVTRLPITLLLPATSVASLAPLNRTGALTFFAQELQALTGSRSLAFWEKRLRRMLHRPEAEGTALLVLIDGLNQDPSFDWQRLLQILQGPPFGARLRLMVTTQTDFLNHELRNLHHLSVRPARLEVTPYDPSPGGELEEILRLNGLSIIHLDPELKPLACIPRMFPLLIPSLSDPSMSVGVTPATLLWEYGRDRLSNRENRAFSEPEWLAWLHRMAERFRDAIDVAGDFPSYSRDDLGSSVHQSYLEPKQIRLRLAEIVGGTWVEALPNQPGRYRPKAETIELALGVGLLAHLESTAERQLGATLSAWMEPIEGTSFAPGILASALAISASKGEPRSTSIDSLLVATLLQSQNASEAHRRSLLTLAPILAEPLLNAVQRSVARAHAAARAWAIKALHAIPSSHTDPWGVIYRRLHRWPLIVVCPSPAQKARQDAHARRLSEKLIDTIGSDVEGDYEVLGLQITLSATTAEDLTAYIPPILQGHALTPAVPIFVAASIATAIDWPHRASFDGLRWLVLMNQIDPEQTIAALSEAAQQLLDRNEHGSWRALSRQAARLLLSLAGTRTAESTAAELAYAETGEWSYEKRYLNDPAHSFFQLERWHVAEVLARSDVSPESRLRRIRHYLPDPSVAIDDDCLNYLALSASAIEVSKLDLYRGSSQEDHVAGKLIIDLARFLPASLAALTRRRLHDLAQRNGEALHWASLRAPEGLLVCTQREAGDARHARMHLGQLPAADKLWRTSCLLMLEIPHRTGEEQLRILCDAELDEYPMILLELLRPVSANFLETLVLSASSPKPSIVRVVLNYLAIFGTPLTSSAFDALVAYIDDADIRGLRTLAFMGLAASCPSRLGKLLLSRGWQPHAADPIFLRDAASVAMLAVATSTPLRQLAGFIVPWRLLQEARRRGGAHEDALVATDAIHTAIAGKQPLLDEPRPFEIAIQTDDEISRVAYSALPADEDFESQVARFVDSEGDIRAQDAASTAGRAFMHRAQDIGAHLHAQLIPIEDVTLVVRQCPDAVNQWLDGMQERSRDFRGRVVAAAGLFRALCEVLLEMQPHRGAALWKSLKETLHLRLVGPANIDDMLHMLFRVRESPDVLVLQREIYSVHCSQSDASYFEIVVCALWNERASWVKERVHEDLASTELWRHKRATLILGFLELPEIDTLRWPSGPVLGQWDHEDRAAMGWRNQHALSHYWWRQFVEAQTTETAFAAWHVFLSCADRRAWKWIDDYRRPNQDNDPLRRLKLVQIAVNEHVLTAAMKKREKDGLRELNRHLFGAKAPVHSLDLTTMIDG